ncbi:Protein of unknown function [Cotesia congregata]|uniref:Uncharacterized protein n=1 Tax=Cotesia congregata TaxID=51543 RepID=A0A8J2H6L9_COTCN|nr:Protein of unknown function [Cotesia congregata]
MRREIILLIIFWGSVTASVEWDRLKIIDSKYKDSSERLRSDAVSLMRELVEICFVNNSNPVVISEDLLDNNWDPGRNPLIVIDRKFDKQITGFLPTYPMYVLAFESIDELKSTFWNIKSPFLIVETDSRCLSTKTILKFMWKQNLIAVYHLCDQKNSTVVFTLNSFASYAPAPWELIAEFDDDEGKKMTLCRFQYTKGTFLHKIT